MTGLDRGYPERRQSAENKTGYVEFIYFLFASPQYNYLLSFTLGKMAEKSLRSAR